MVESNPVIMKTAFEALEERKRKLCLTTGSGDVDSLIGGIEEGHSYLFYGEHEMLDLLIHRLVVNCILSVEDGGFQSKSVYFNNTDYYAEKTILNPDELGNIAKSIGVDPATVLENTYLAAAYNEQRQLIVAKQVASILERDGKVKLLTIHNLTKFFGDSKKPNETRQVLKQVISYLWWVASKRKLALVVTGEALPTSRGFVPKAVGGNFFRHVCNVIVHFRKFYDGPISSYKATLVKHPYKRTPESILLYVSQGGLDLMGRITPSFRQLYEKRLNELRQKYKDYLVDLGHREAFDLLIKEAWNAEQAAMGNSKVPTVLDSMNLTGNIHNRKLIEAHRKKIEEQKGEIEELKDRISRLEALRKETSQDR